jgi:hypothetical protein
MLHHLHVAVANKFGEVRVRKERDEAGLMTLIPSVFHDSLFTEERRNCITDIG